MDRNYLNNSIADRTAGRGRHEDHNLLAVPDAVLRPDVELAGMNRR